HPAVEQGSGGREHCGYRGDQGQGFHWAFRFYHLAPLVLAAELAAERGRGFLARGGVGWSRI
ncbi:MAG: hypothetical protein OXN97_08770, partial [Bryobacterales bacterium]|nr:hypothetical protein [Bryobacterales bacterium]